MIRPNSVQNIQLFPSICTLRTMLSAQMLNKYIFLHNIKNIYKQTKEIKLNACCLKTGFLKLWVGTQNGW